MRIVAVLLLLFSCVLHAQAPGPAPMPSGISGDYIGAGYNCRLTIDGAPSSIDHWQVRMRCFEPDGDISDGTTTIYGCPDTYSGLFLSNGRSLIDSQWLYIRSIDLSGAPYDTQLKVRVAPFYQFAQVVPPADGGMHFTLYRVGYIPPVPPLCGIWPPTSTAKDE